MNKGKAFDVNKITSSRDAYEILKRIYGRNPIQENFIMLLFNRANKLIGYYRHTIGTSSATMVDIPMIIGLATKALAQGIVISHNHPSATLAPSDPDRELTRNIIQALKTVKINLLDHIIYTNDGYYSFADEGTLNGLKNTTMITLENIISEYPGIDQAILPDVLKVDEFEFIHENIDLYNDDETIKKYIDAFIEKLNKFAAKGKSGIKTKQDREDAEPPKLKASDIPAIVKKFMPEFQQRVIIGSEEHFEIIERLEREIKAIPKDTRASDKAYEKAQKKGKANYMDFYTVYAHFFIGGSNWYVLSWDGDQYLSCYVVLNSDTRMSEMGDVALSEFHENHVELDFFWEIKSLSKALHDAYPSEFPEPSHTEKEEVKKETSGKETHPTVPSNNEKAKKIVKEKAQEESSAKAVEKITTEISFIKRYAGLHGKTKNRAQILNLLNALQKAILEKRIRKTSPYAKEIQSIQSQLIKCYNQMGNAIKITIDDKTLESYREIAASEKSMLSVLYIKQYIGLHGKKDVKDKAGMLLEKLENTIQSGKINQTDDYYDEVSEIRSSLKSYLGNKTKAPAIKESTLNGIMNWLENRKRKKKVAKYLQKIYETEKGLKGVDVKPVENPMVIKPDEIISSMELAKLDFKTIGFTGKWLNLIGDPSERFTAMFYGGPGCGKSTLAMEFAYYLAKDHAKKVLYIANEEKVSKTLQDKLKLVQGNHPNLNFVGVLRKDKFNEYDCIFIDSVNTLNVTPVDLEEIAASHPRLSIIYICQTTKEGKYRGSREFEHFADVVIRIENGVARPEKNRFGGRGELVIFQPVQQTVENGNS